MNCEQVKREFPDYLVKSLGQESSAAIQAHLATCVACREELVALGSVWSRLGVLEDSQPGPQVRARFYAMLEEHQIALRSQPKRRVTFGDWLEGWWPVRPVWQFALGLLLLSVGVGLGRWSFEKPKQDGEIARLRDEVGGLRELLTLSLLQQQSASERLRGVSWSSQVQQPEEPVLSALLQTLNSDPNVNVRLAALDALQNFSNLREVREGLLYALEKQKSPLVQITLIDWLVKSKERQAVNVLTRISHEPQFQPKVRERARWGLRQLS
jgi:hypothetical protein